MIILRDKLFGKYDRQLAREQGISLEKLRANRQVLNPKTLAEEVICANSGHEMDNFNGSFFYKKPIQSMSILDESASKNKYLLDELKFQKSMDKSLSSKQAYKELGRNKYRKNFKEKEFKKSLEKRLKDNLKERNDIVTDRLAYKPNLHSIQETRKLHFVPKETVTKPVTGSISGTNKRGISKFIKRGFGLLKRAV